MFRDFIPKEQQRITNPHLFFSLSLGVDEEMVEEEIMCQN